MRTIAILAATILAAGAVQARGQDDQAPDYSAMSDAELRQASGSLAEGFYDRACDRSVPLLEEQFRRFGLAELESGLFLARSFCADREGRFADAAKWLGSFEERVGRLSMVSYRLYLAERLDDPQMALATLRQLAEDGSGEEVRSLSGDVYFGAARVIRRQLGASELEELALGLFSNGRYALYDVDIQPSLASAALVAAARDARREMVPELLSLIRSPIAYPDLLADRRFENVWPEIEEFAGPNLTRVSESHREWALARLDIASDDRDRFSQAAHALHFDGQFEEAVALARGWREREGAFDAIEEGDAWALNIEAYALDSLGREAEADGVFDRLAELDPDGRPWVVNFVINRASRLVGQKRFEEGLAATSLARTVAEKYGTPYAKMLIARDRTCALHGLGRGDEAAEELDFLRANRKEAVFAAVQGLLCAGHREEAVGMVFEGLADEKLRAGVLSKALPDEFELFYTRSELPSMSELVASEPRLQAEYLRWARPIPREFVPRASLLREAATRR